MDVGLIVNQTGLIAAFFAFLSCLALACELGRKPQLSKPIDEEEEIEEARRKERERKERERKEKEKAEKDKAEQEKAAEAARASTPPPVIPQNPFAAQLLAQQTAEAKPAPAQFPAPSANLPPAGDGMEKTMIPEKPFDQVKLEVPASEQNQFEKMARRQAAEASDKLATLQRTYVDGLLAPRGKYDVALAILNEYNEATTALSQKDVGLTMATEAYLSATRTGSITTAVDIKSIFTLKKSDGGATTEDTRKEPAEDLKKEKKEKAKDSSSKTSRPASSRKTSASGPKKTTSRETPKPSQARNKKTDEKD